MELTPNQQLVITAYEKGYRIENGMLYNPKKIPLKGTRHPSNYSTFSIKHMGSARTVYYHTLLAYQKYGDAMFEGKLVVRHLDGNHQNNSWDNIVLGTYQENTQDISSTNRSERVRKAQRSLKILNSSEIRENIKKLHASGTPIKMLGEKYSLHVATIRKIVNGEWFPSKKIDDSIKAMVRELISRNRTDREISKELEISVPTVNILRRKY